MKKQIQFAFSDSYVKIKKVSHKFKRKMCLSLITKIYWNQKCRCGVWGGEGRVKKSALPLQLSAGLGSLLIDTW